MHFYSLGNKTNPTLFILHGWGLSGEQYKELATILSSDFYVLVPDLMGFGKTPASKKPYKLLSYVKEIEDFLKQEKISQAFFIAHSFGGRILIKLARRSPKLMKALVLTGAPGVEKFYWKRSFKRAVYFMVAKVLKLFFFVPQLEALRKRFYEKRDLGKLEGVMKKTFLNIIKESLDDDARKIKTPTLLLWGSRDQMALPCDAEKLLEIIPGSYLKIFSKVGHNLPYEKPHEFAREVLSFFNRFL